ncbi:MAG: DUF2094 domain-containing protein [Acidobacteria bacterium]|nr:MAG: DUF2094 domain-containing protein [Acidobacteriota bacterium]
MASEYLVPGCFGKLPLDREYLESDVSSPAALLLRRLLREMREEGEVPPSVADGEAPNSPRITSRNVLFLLNVPGGSDLLAGIVRPSHDQGGREFPFALFVHIPRKTFGRHYALLPMALAATWEGLSDVWRSLFGLETKDAFEEMFASMEIPAPADYTEIKASYQAQTRESMEHLFTRAGGLAPDCVDGRLPEVIEQVRKSGHGLQVRLPASPDLRQAGYEASFWIDLFNRQFMMRRIEPSVFLHHDPGAKVRWMLLGVGETSDAATKALIGGQSTSATLDLSGSPEAVTKTESNPDFTMTYEDVLKQRFRGGA